eukprot:5562371-Pyramimonas_sp.AAC.1
MIAGGPEAGARQPGAREQPEAQRAGAGDAQAAGPGKLHEGLRVLHVPRALPGARVPPPHGQGGLPGAEE